MPEIRDVYRGRYLTVQDLGGRPMEMTITSCDLEPVGIAREEKLVLQFREDDRGLPLNVTNAKSIQKILGASNTDLWKGKRVELYPAKTDFKGESVDCVRVRPVTESAFHDRAA